MKKMEKDNKGTASGKGTAAGKGNNSSFAGKMFFKCSRCQNVYYEICGMNYKCRCRNCGADNLPERKGTKKLIQNRIFHLLMELFVVISVQSK